MPQFNLEDAIFKISADLAKNTASTENIERHLAVLNGKVASQESTSATLESSFKLAQVAIDNIQKREEKRDEIKDRAKWFTVEKVVAIFQTLLIAYIVYKLGIK